MPWAEGTLNLKASTLRVLEVYLFVAGEGGREGGREGERERTNAAKPEPVGLNPFPSQGLGFRF